MSIDNKKKCTSCHAQKPLTDFSIHKRNGRLSKLCDRCKKRGIEYTKVHWSKVKEQSRNRWASYYKDSVQAGEKRKRQRKDNATIGTRYCQIKNDAKNRGLLFCITKEQLALFWQKPCYYCGDTLKTVSVDRKDPTGDYVLENLVPCCTLCNRMKHILPFDTFISHVRKISNNQK